MTPEIHTRVGLTAAFAVAAALAAATPAQSMPIDLRSPDARDAGAAQQAFGGSYRPVVPKNGMDHRAIEAALAQEQYYSSHKPADAESGLQVETDARDVAPVTAPAAASGGFELDDAAIGAGSALGLVLVLAGGAAAVSRRRRAVTS